MTAPLLAIQDTQGLIDGAIIGACMIAILAIGTWWDRREMAAWNRPLLVPEDLPVLDHALCAIDGCDTILCFCKTLHPVTGQPVTCPGARPPACPHSLISRATTGGHCYTHQGLCPDCKAEDLSQWGGVR